MSKRKKMIRLAALIGVLLIAVIGFVLHFSIEPADYRGSIQKAVTAANKLLDAAEVGNDNGQYSLNAVESLRSEVGRAQRLLDGKQSTISEEKQQCETLKTAANQFKESANQNSLSAVELEQLKKTMDKFTREVQVSASAKAAWEIDLSAISKPEAINLDIKADSAHQGEIDQLLKQKGIDGTLLSLRHNGQLPAASVIRFGYTPQETGAYLYHYDAEKNVLQYSSDVAVVDGRAVLVVSQGGDWVVTAHKLEESSSSVASSSGSSTENSFDASSQAASETEGGSSSKGSAGSSAQGGTASGDSSGGLQPNDNGNENSGGEAVPDGNNPPAPEQTNTCTIEIRCDTILDNLGDLNPAKTSYVPSDGVILSHRTVEFKEGESAFDVLKRVTRDNKIQMEYEMKAMYSGVYINGIGNLYERDCGSQSGWMYQVNGVFPQFGISNYTLKSGDQIRLLYSCKGYGADVGDHYTG